MKITVNNIANVPKKYIRYIKWRLRKLKLSFEELTAAEVFIRTIGKSNTLYNVHVNIQSSENELFISKADKDLDKIVRLIPNMFLSRLAKDKVK